MKWLGDKLKELVAKAGYTQAQISERLGVSRQTYNDWISGQVPKGLHLIAISRLLDVGAEDLFAAGPSPVQVAPVHRKRPNVKVDREMQDAAKELAMEYASLLETQELPIIEPVVRQNDEITAGRLAVRMREMAGLSDCMTPMDYRHTFGLLNKLGICVIFRQFPDSIKSRALFTVINGHRVVLVNSAENVLDLIFCMLHEAVHAIRNRNPGDGWDKAEEDFCDRVAGLVQFPDNYVDDVRKAIQDRAPGVQVNVLKDFAGRHHHAIYGIVKRIEEKSGAKLGLDPKSQNGADANLRKAFPTLGDALASSGNVSTFVQQMEALTPIWLDIVCRNADEMTTSKLADMIDLGVIDALAVRDELLARQKRMANGCSL